MTAATGHKQIMTATAKIIKIGLLLVALFLFLVYVFPGGAAIEIMNGAITGVGVVIFLTFRNLTWETIRGKGQYARAQQMALGLALMWTAVNLRTAQSVWYRATEDIAVLNTAVGAAITYMFLIAGIMQATAPGFGRGFLHGQSRVRVGSAMFLGAVVCVGVIWLQSRGI